MKIMGEYTFAAPVETVWEALLDPVVLASIMPGCEKLELTGEGRYEGDLKVKIGPVQGKFQGQVNLEEIEERKGYTIHVDGKGNQGFVKATARVALEAEGNKTQMRYDGDARVGGRVASVGQRLLDASAKAIIKQSLEGLNRVVVSRASGGGEGDDSPEAAAPLPQMSQAKLAANVVKEVTKELIPAPVRIALVVGSVAVVIVVAYLLFV